MTFFHFLLKNEKDVPFHYYFRPNSSFSFLNVLGNVGAKLFYEYFQNDVEKYAVELEGIKFIPNIMCIRKEVNQHGEIDYFLNQYEFDIMKILPNTKSNPYILNLVPRGIKRFRLLFFFSFFR